MHITISDFQLNLDPTADDAWTLNTDGTSGYNNVLVDDDNDEDTPSVPVTIDFDGSNGVLDISGSNENRAVINDVMQMK